MDPINKYNEIMSRWDVDQKQFASGGQGACFYAKQKEADPEKMFVLKKLIKIDRSDRFKKEIETMQKIEHPNLIRIKDSFTDFIDKKHKPFYIMEYYEKGNLDSNIESFKGNILQVLNIFLDVCKGVDALHKSGIIHRDIKPANILVKEIPSFPFVFPVVADFGLCYECETDKTRLTETREAVGPRIYMAPEFEDGRADEVTTSADCYSLGKLLYWMLSGSIFAREKHRDSEYDLCELIGYECRAINELLDKLIIADPSKRLQDASYIRNEIQKLIPMYMFEITPVGSYDEIQNKFLDMLEENNEIKIKRYLEGASNKREQILEEIIEVNSDIDEKKEQVFLSLIDRAVIEWWTLVSYGITEYRSNLFKCFIDSYNKIIDSAKNPYYETLPETTALLCFELTYRLYSLGILCLKKEKYDEAKQIMMIRPFFKGKQEDCNLFRHTVAVRAYFDDNLKTDRESILYLASRYYFNTDWMTKIIKVSREEDFYDLICGFDFLSNLVTYHQIGEEAIYPSCGRFYQERIDWLLNQIVNKQGAYSVVSDMSDADLANGIYKLITFCQENLKRYSHWDIHDLPQAVKAFLNNNLARIR